MLFTKKDKQLNRSANKKGCLKKLVIGVVIIVVFGIISIIAAAKTLNIYGTSLSTFNEYVEWLNEDVNESALTKNAIMGNDYTAFKEKAMASGFSAFDLNGNVNLNIPNIALTQNLTLQDYELGAMINNATQQNDGQEFIKLLELSITEISDNLYNLTTVMKFDLSEIKNAIGSQAKNVPSSIYFTCSGMAYTTGSRIQTRDNTIKINQLSNDKNEKIVGFFKTIAEETDNEDILKIININNYIVSEILSDITNKSGTTPVLGNGTFSFILK